MPEITQGDLKNELAAGKLRSLYVLAGEEKFLVKREARRLIKRAAGEEFPDFNRNELSSSATVDAIADAALALPLFAQHKCVSVADFNAEDLNAADTKKLFELLENLPETTSLIFWYPTLDFSPKKAGKWSSFIKAAGERGALLFFDSRSVPDLQRLLIREAEKAGCVLQKQNANKIIDYAGHDITRLLNELEKLCAYVLGTGVGEITGEMIEEMTYRTTEITVFLMSDALLAGNYEEAYRHLGTLFYQNEEPVAILAALSTAYVDMYRVQVALESGLRSASAAQYGDYRNPESRLRRAERNLRRLRPGALEKSLALLLEADGALKGSRLSGRIVLEELIAKLLLAASGERGA